jgi:quercetin dioxygenase-like cupin family protein
MNAQLKIIDDICVGSKALNRASILKYEEFAKTQPQIEIPVTHRIHGGMYMREITIPKDCYITGHIYKFNHFDVMISGDITVSTDSGEKQRLTGYNVFNGMNGKKRAGYAHEDTTWLTVHPFNGFDGEEIQKRITAETFEELREFQINANVLDFNLMLQHIGVSHKDMIEISEFEGDMMDMPRWIDTVEVRPSEISGYGLFATKKIYSGAEICPARIDGKRTPAGRYTNHGFQENAEIKLHSGDALLIAKADIHEGEEITINYRDVINTRLNGGDLCQE